MERHRIATGAIAALATLWLGAAAQAAGPSFEGKKMTIYVGFSAGGTNDSYTRLIARHIGRHLPGQPSVIVTNMPGAGSRTLAAYLSAKAPKDGRALGNLSRDLLVESVLYPNPTEDFDLRSLTWIGSPTRELMTCVTWHTSPVQTLVDLKSKTFVIASSGGHPPGEVIAANVLNALIGAKVQAVTGYPGGSEMNFAMQNGEVHGRCALGWGAIQASYFDQIEKKKMKVLIQLSVAGDPDLEGVPVLYDLVAPNDRPVLDLLFANQAVGRPIAAPPGLPAALTKTLRDGFQETLKDPQLLAESKKLHLEIKPVKGQEIAALVDRLYAASPETLARARKLAKP